MTLIIFPSFRTTSTANTWRGMPRRSYRTTLPRYSGAKWDRPAVRSVSSDASGTSYAADLRASLHPSHDASGGDTTFCPTRTLRRAGHRPRRAVRVRTTDSVRTTTRKHWSPAEQIRCRAPGRERREAVSCWRERSTVTGHSPGARKSLIAIVQAQAASPPLLRIGIGDDP
jgi:hypothetical protein